VPTYYIVLNISITYYKEYRVTKSSIY